MTQTLTRPIILKLPCDEVKPRILRLPKRGGKCRSVQVAVAHVAQGNEPSDAELSAVRDRLLRMIVANEWDRSHGNRAS